MLDDSGDGNQDTDPRRARLAELARAAPLDAEAREMTAEELNAWGRGYRRGWLQGYQDGGER